MRRKYAKATPTRSPAPKGSPKQVSKAKDSETDITWESVGSVIVAVLFMISVPASCALLISCIVSKTRCTDADVSACVCVLCGICYVSSYALWICCKLCARGKGTDGGRGSEGENAEQQELNHGDVRRNSGAPTLIRRSPTGISQPEAISPISSTSAGSIRIINASPLPTYDVAVAPHSSHNDHIDYSHRRLSLPTYDDAVAQELIPSAPDQRLCITPEPGMLVPTYEDAEATARATCSNVSPLPMYEDAVATHSSNNVHIDNSHRGLSLPTYDDAAAHELLSEPGVLLPHVEFVAGTGFVRTDRRS